MKVPAAANSLELLFYFLPTPLLRSRDFSGVTSKLNLVNSLLLTQMLSHSQPPVDSRQLRPITCFKKARERTEHALELYQIEYSELSSVKTGSAPLLLLKFYSLSQHSLSLPSDTKRYMLAVYFHGIFVSYNFCVTITLGLECVHPKNCRSYCYVYLGQGSTDVTVQQFLKPKELRYTRC